MQKTKSDNFCGLPLVEQEEEKRRGAAHPLRGAVELPERIPTVSRKLTRPSPKVFGEGRCSDDYAAVSSSLGRTGTSKTVRSSCSINSTSASARAS